MNNRGSNIARGWSYSQQSNLYLKKAALYSLENPRILWSCQPLISKGSLADRDLDLSYGARELWFWHQICRYYTVCHHVEAYTLGRLSIDGFSFERVAQSNLEWIFSKLDSGFQSLVGFRIPCAGFRIPQAKNSWIPESGFPYMGRGNYFLLNVIMLPEYRLTLNVDIKAWSHKITTPTFLWGIWIIDVVWSYVLILHLKKNGEWIQNYRVGICELACWMQCLYNINSPCL